MKEFVPLFFFFLRSDVSYKFKSLISQQMTVLHLSEHARSDKTMRETLIMIQKKLRQEGGWHCYSLRAHVMHLL